MSYAHVREPSSESRPPAAPSADSYDSLDFDGAFYGSEYPPPPSYAISQLQHLQAQRPRKRELPLWTAVIERIELAKYRYEVTFGLYVMTPYEKLVVNMIVLFLLALLTVTLFVYFPRACARLSWRAGYILWGSRPGVGWRAFYEYVEYQQAHFRAMLGLVERDMGTTVREAEGVMRLNDTMRMEL